MAIAEVNIANWLFLHHAAPKDFLNSKKNKHVPLLIGMQVDGTDSITIRHEKGGIQLTFLFRHFEHP